MVCFRKCLWVFLLGCLSLFGQKPVFQVVPLGVMGGLDEKNLSAYLLGVVNTNAYICLDAGTLNAGIEKAIENKLFKRSSREVLRKCIKGYLISHAHLDHVSGLIINSPADTSKTVYATNKCMDMLEKHYFNGDSWANFGDEGPGVRLNKYHFQRLPLKELRPIDQTELSVKAYELSHVNPFESTAFLIQKAADAVLYLGDTGPDAVEKSTNLDQLWKAVSPLVAQKKLKGIFIEVSFPNEQPDAALFGHLTPNHLMTELHKLEAYAGKGALKDLKIIITHLKPPYESIVKIKEQLKIANDLGLSLIFPEQGKAFEL